jgi:hypothetical protein
VIKTPFGCWIVTTSPTDTVPGGPSRSMTTAPSGIAGVIDGPAMMTSRYPSAGAM